MNLIRLAIIGLIVWLLYRMFYRMLNKPKPQQKVKQQAPSHNMVKCAHCGIHIPTNEALHHNGHDYCSPEHRDAGPSGPGE
ncbi:MAG: PP0621 family protein [Gammaproteobacteria bacterium]|nr:PP0621 family protein [Gammaproteobacteria bacterium]MCW8839833.1 PP0621 family protein [Gammaproteobacteria bacterium]MCW8958428.1 PP0621 family protein [Gammaproteobacteria bacterium]MCW8973800.1 PP0621 family protein [Gammaproteobacteria bacterium]MCW8993489.1 PP0621 family protein [Gammaproteobacteria bacterium]